MADVDLKTMPTWKHLIQLQAWKCRIWYLLPFLVGNIFWNEWSGVYIAGSTFVKFINEVQFEQTEVEMIFFDYFKYHNFNRWVFTAQLTLFHEQIKQHKKFFC